MGLPTQDKCDMGKADEHFLWALLNIGDSIGAPLLVPEPICGSGLSTCIWLVFVTVTMSSGFGTRCRRTA